MHLDMMGLLTGLLTSGFVVGVAFKIASAKLPKIVVGLLHKLFGALRASAWIRNPEKPRRVLWFKATLELLEDEIPEPGQGQAFYAGLSTELVSFLKTNLPIFAQFLVGTTDRWASLLEPMGDALDTELDEEIKDLLD